MRLAESRTGDAFEEGEIAEDEIELKPAVEVRRNTSQTEKSLNRKGDSSTSYKECHLKSLSYKNHSHHKDKTSRASESKRAEIDRKESRHHLKSTSKTLRNSPSGTDRRESDYRSHIRRTRDHSERTEGVPRSHSRRHRNQYECERSSSHRRTFHDLHSRRSSSSKYSSSRDKSRDVCIPSEVKNHSSKHGRNGISTKEFPETKRFRHAGSHDGRTSDEQATGAMSGSESRELDGLLVVDEEERLIEERRKRRVEILMKHERTLKDDVLQDERGIQITEAPADPEHKVATSTNTSGREEIPVNTRRESLPRDSSEPQRGSNQPGDNSLDRVKSHSARETTESETHTPLVVDPEWGASCMMSPSVDMFALEEVDLDNNKDISRDDKEEMQSNTQSKMEKQMLLRNMEDPALIDNWDDNEGYYRPVVGEKLDGRYIVLGMLGKGVFSSVVLTSDLMNNGEEVAVKIIRSNETMYRAGIKELSILKKLTAADPKGKKHIVRLLCHFEHRNHLCLVFENLCMNLRDVLKKFGKDVGLNIKAVRVYAQQLLIALSLLRKCGILHADIKPDNILVSKSKNILKLCDLGSALEITDTEITPYLVSRFYRAPEVILGLPHSPSLDVWSVACTLYELYTGRFLFPGRSNNQMLKLMMDLKGKIPNKVLRKGLFTHKHFDVDLNFMQMEVDKVTGKEIKRKVAVSRPIKDLRSLIEVSSTNSNNCAGKSKEEAEVEVTLLSQFISFLDKALHLNPEKRLTVREALMQPFINFSPVS